MKILSYIIVSKLAHQCAIWRQHQHKIGQMRAVRTARILELRREIQAEIAPKLAILRAAEDYSATGGDNTTDHRRNRQEYFFKYLQTYKINGLERGTQVIDSLAGFSPVRENAINHKTVWARINTTPNFDSYSV
jgi:hypothetical protein